MPEVSVTLSADLAPTARMRQVAAIFDAPIAEKTTRTWSGRVPLEDRDWQIGLIVGPTGAGKSTIAPELFGPSLEIAWPTTASVIDSFDASLSTEQICAALSAVGFNTIPGMATTVWHAQQRREVPLRPRAPARRTQATRLDRRVHQRRRSAGRQDRRARVRALRALDTRPALRGGWLPLRRYPLAATGLGPRAGGHDVRMEVSSTTPDHRRNRPTSAARSVAASLRITI